MKEARCNHPQCRGPRAVRGLCAYHAFEALRIESHLNSDASTPAPADDLRAQAASVGLTLAPALATVSTTATRKVRSPVA